MRAVQGSGHPYVTFLLKKFRAKVINPFVNTGRDRAPGTTSLTLLDRARAESPEAWSRLVEVYAPTIYRWCRNDGLPSEDAKDVTQDVLFKVCQKIRDFSQDGEDSSFRRWLRRIARNKANDYWRRARSRPNRARGGGDCRQSICRDAVGETPSQAESLDPRIAAFLQVMENIRERCGEKSWAIFTYYVTDGFTAEEASREFGVSVAYVHQVRARMLHRLRVEFEREYPQ
jgi:RNA polymerase sigma-70 factor (ECF subfamily)